MRSQLAIPYYSPRDTLLHHLPNGMKLMLVLFYVALTLICYKPISIIFLLASFIGITLCMHFPLRGWPISIILFISLGYLVFSQDPGNVLTNILILIAKVMIVYLVTALFSRSTRLTDLLNNLSSYSEKINILKSILYVINTILAILPSIQYEFNKAVTAEEIRRRKPLRFYNIDSFMLILNVTLVRILKRSERFTDTVLERGLNLKSHFVFSEEKKVSVISTVLGLLFFIPGLLIAWLELSVL